MKVLLKKKKKKPKAELNKNWKHINLTVPTFYFNNPSMIDIVQMKPVVNLKS